MSNYNCITFALVIQVEITVCFKNMKIQWKPLNTASVYGGNRLTEHRFMEQTVYLSSFG